METGTEGVVGDGGGGFEKVVFRPFADTQRSPRSKDEKPDPTLSAGMPLPIHLRPSFPKNLIGKPIDDFDPFYQNKNTFVVVGGHWIIYRYDADKSLFLMSADNRVRQMAITVSTNSFAQYFMFLVIFFYAILHTEGYSHHLTITTMFFFFVIFMSEIIVKVIASGFLLKNFAYLRDPWNWLDFVATLLMFTSLLGIGHVTPYRIIRLVNFFTESRLLFASTYNVLLKMRDILFYVVFTAVFWSMLFMNLYLGIFKNKCIKGQLENDTPPLEMHIEIEDHWFSEDEHLPMLCGNATHSLPCPHNYSCISGLGKNPDYTLTNFDNVFLSSISVFRVMTLEWWDNLFDQVHATTGPHSLFFFLLVIVFGSYMVKIFVAAHMFENHGQMLDILMDRKNLNKMENKLDTEKEMSREEDSKDTALVDVPFADDVTTHFKRESIVPIAEPELVILSNNKSTENEEGKDNNIIKDSMNPLESCCSTFSNYACAWQCCGCCTKMQEFLSRIVLHRHFDIFICITIIINTITMAMDHHGMSRSFEVLLFRVNYIVLLVYFVEAAVKILAMSPKKYFGDSWCRFEFMIVFLAFIELGLENVSGLSVLRAFRLLRVIRIGKFYRHFNSLLTIGLARFYVVFVFVFYFTIIGGFVFGETYMQNVHLFVAEQMPRFAFIDFIRSLLIVIRILCGGWIEAFWHCNLVAGNICIPFFFVAVVFGNLLILNIIISYVMIGFTSHNICETENEFDEKEDSIFTRIGAVFCRLCSVNRCCQNGAGRVPSAKSEEHLCEVSLEGEVKPTDLTVHVNSEEVPDVCCPTVCYSWFPFCGSPSTSPTATPQSPFWNTWQNFRNRLLLILNNDTYRNIFATFVLVTSFVAFFPVGDGVSVVRLVDIIVLIVFSFELFQKFCAVGCKTYFSMGWNRFDFVVTILHLCSCLFGSSLGDIGSYFNAMRILKLFSYNRRLTVVVEAILFRFSYILNAVFSSFIIWVIFGIIGVQLFGGAFYSCIDEGERLHYKVTNNKNECFHMNFTWIQEEINFDHIGNAFVALLQVATTHGGIVVMFDAMDNRGREMQPFRDTNIFMSFYFICFMYVCVLCCYAFVFMSFLKKVNAQERNQGGYILSLMTTIQKAIYSNRKKTLFERPLKTLPEPTMSICKPFYNVVTSQKFSVLIFLVLIFAAVTLAIDEFDTTHRMGLALSYIQFVFVVVFTIEILLKLIAFGRSFFSSSWNVYDFCVIAPLPLCIISQEFAAKYFVSHVLIMFLVVLRLIRRIRYVRRVFVTLRIWLPVVFNVTLLLFVVIFFYAAVGVRLFGDYQFNHGIDELRNFKSLLSALQLMIRLAFDGSWDAIYSGLIHCEWNAERCFGAFHVFAFLWSFKSICFLVFLQVGSVLILEYYECLVRKRQLGITDEDLEDFNAVWRIFDPYGNGSIPDDHFSDFLTTLAAPFKCEQPNNDKIAALAVPVSSDNRVQYEDVLQSLLRHLDKNDIGCCESNKCDTLRQQQEDDSARKIQKWWKNRQ